MSMTMIHQKRQIVAFSGRRCVGCWIVLGKWSERIAWIVKVCECVNCMGRKLQRDSPKFSEVEGCTTERIVGARRRPARLSSGRGDVDEAVAVHYVYCCLQESRSFGWDSSELKPRPRWISEVEWKSTLLSRPVWSSDVGELSEGALVRRFADT